MQRIADKGGDGHRLAVSCGIRSLVPIRALAGSAGQMRITIRVTPEARPSHVSLLTDTAAIPRFLPKTGGDLQVAGQFTVGTGKYRVDWLARDNRDRACSAHWNIEARTSEDLKRIPLPLPPDTVDVSPNDPFHDATPINSVIRMRSL